MTGGQGQVVRKPLTMGDAAVDGLFSGLGAGLVMGIYLVLVGLLNGENPGTVFSRFSSGSEVSPWAGLFNHLSVSAFYGLLYGLLALFLFRAWPQLHSSIGLLVGLFYGVILWGVAQLILLPGTGSPLDEIPVLHLAVAHLLYGVSLEKLVNWAGKP